MFFLPWLTNAKTKTRKPARSRRHGFKPWLEILEDRLAPAAVPTTGLLPTLVSSPVTLDTSSQGLNVAGGKYRPHQ